MESGEERDRRPVTSMGKKREKGSSIRIIISIMQINEVKDMKGNHKDKHKH